MALAQAMGTSSNRLHSVNTAGNKRDRDSLGDHLMTNDTQVIYGGSDEDSWRNWRGLSGRTWVMLWQGWKQHTAVTTLHCSDSARGTYTTTESPLDVGGSVSIDASDQRQQSRPSAFNMLSLMQQVRRLVQLPVGAVNGCGSLNLLPVRLNGLIPAEMAS